MQIKNEIDHNLVKPYKQRKKILDLRILEKAYHIKRSYLFMLLAAIIIFILNRKYFLFGLMTVFSFLFSFYHAKFNRTPMDFKLALFLGLYITRFYGLLFTMIFFVVTDMIPSLLGGESLQGSDLFFIVWYFLINAAVFIFPAVPLYILGPILVVIEAFGSFFINSWFGIPGLVSFFVSFLTIVVRIIYFLTLGRILDVLFMSVAV
jgi:hypothetical protein